MANKIASVKPFASKTRYSYVGRKSKKEDDYLLLVKSKLFYIYIFSIVYVTIEPCVVDAVRDVDLKFPPYLRKPDGKIIDPKDYFDFDFLYVPNKTYSEGQNIETHSYNLIKAFDYANLYRLDHWNYSSGEDLRLSSQPVANQERCGEQLSLILHQINDTSNIFKHGLAARHLSEYLDSFGRPEPSTTFGNQYWLGSYYVCLNTKLYISTNSSDSVSEEALKTRYCVGKVRAHSWPEDNYMPPISYKVGLCLPETCDTTSIKLYKSSIETIMKFNFASFQKDRYYLHDMYCLPDERSPIRRQSLSSHIYVSLCLAWLSLVLLGSFIYKRHKQTGSKEFCQIEENKMDMLNGTEDTNQLSTLRNRSPVKVSVGMAIVKSFSISENLKEFFSAPQLLDSRINLNSLDLIKVLCTMLIIWGHIVFIYMQHIVVVKEAVAISNDWFPRILLAFFNLVDSFFTIAGFLISYFLFKRFSKKQLAKPQIWFLFIVMRLVRLTPVYLVVYWFIKTTVVYLGSGPTWDYGTDELSPRGLCMRDPWWKSILYLGNYDSMQPYCILPAWSIVVDAQYSLLVPPVVWVISRNKPLGYFILVIGAFVSTLDMTWQLMTQNSAKTDDMAKVRLHVYPILSRFSADFYNSMWNRLGPLAIGMMGGHMLYEYDMGKIKNLPCWLKGKMFKVVLYLHLIIILLPTVSSYFDRQDSSTKSNKMIFVMCNTTIKPIWSVINTILLLRMVINSNKNPILSRILNHNIWHILAKLTYSLYLVHYELILYNQSLYKEGMRQPGWPYFIKEFLYILTCSVVLSSFIYIVFEAPIYHLIKIVQSSVLSSGKKLKNMKSPNAI